MARQPPVVVVPGGEFAVVLCNRPRQVARTVLLPPPLLVLVLLCSRLRCPACGEHPATQAAQRRSPPDPSLPLHRHYLRRCHYQSPAAHLAALPAPHQLRPDPSPPLHHCHPRLRPHQSLAASPAHLSRPTGLLLPSKPPLPVSRGGPKRSGFRPSSSTPLLPVSFLAFRHGFPVVICWSSVLRSLLVAQSCRPGGRGWATARP